MNEKKRSLLRIVSGATLLFGMFFAGETGVSIIDSGEVAGQKETQPFSISGTVKSGETLFAIFKKHKLDIEDFFKIREVSASVHRVRDLHPGRSYEIQLEDSRIRSFVYWIDDEAMLCITRSGENFCAEKRTVDYEKRILFRSGEIQNNLISSLGETREEMMLAFQLSDIFSWDIDFTTDLRKGDSFKVVVEGLYLGGELRKYGAVLGVEFVNNGTAYRAYRFGQGDGAGYYDETGVPLKKAFLKAPLSFRRISSGFSLQRFHPVLKIERPHHGIDYAAPAGTPVSATGEGTVVFSGRKGGYGKLVILRHRNGYETYYGHLSGVAEGVRKGAVLQQGQTLGYVGSTGIATGPHLHYEMRVQGRPVDPFTVSLPKGASLPAGQLAAFREAKNTIDVHLASLAPPALALNSPDAGAEAIPGRTEEGRKR
ncbi:MAG: M23 family metallopeptidase [Alphaproteobacteria bacterium]|uniref:M23 family metallopeptidase n=1 Tax=Candidatus Nitrobium versatile TaxID=2884831 RepID=A0A953M0C7_9BACT|nr:M23 family metallopeptidase [Candidatus Nitrobium versatile]